MELKRVVTVEVDKFRESQYNQMEQVVSNQRNQVSQKIHPSLLFMDKHNTVMRKVSEYNTLHTSFIMCSNNE